MVQDRVGGPGHSGKSRAGWGSRVRWEVGVGAVVQDGVGGPGQGGCQNAARVKLTQISGRVSVFWNVFLDCLILIFFHF